MASSSATRWRVACDACEASAWLGPADAGFDAWCEACQQATSLAAPPAPGERCPCCGTLLAPWPRFVELEGQLQHLDAVLAGWTGDASALAALLPERPRFVTDLTPPSARAGDAPGLGAALALLARGDWRGVLAAPPDPDARALAARAIAHERVGDLPAAEAMWGQVLERGEDERARLARGSLLARAGSYPEAMADLALAGTSFEAGWDRAACRLHEAARDAADLPAPDVLARARADAGEPSAYWSDPTVGRLLWSLLVERESSRRLAPDAPLPPRARATLRAAESQFEHATFWDRAMMLVGWVRLGENDEVARLAAPLASELAAAVLEEPALAGAPLRELADAVVAARASIEQGDAARARAALAPARRREDLKRFAIPCARCGRGAIAVVETAEVGEEEVGEE